MKSHVFQMKYFLAGIYIICVIFTCFNARFYHTPLAKISSVTEKETMSRKGTRDAEEYYYTQKITTTLNSNQTYSAGRLHTCVNSIHGSYLLH